MIWALLRRHQVRILSLTLLLLPLVSMYVHGKQRQDSTAIERGLLRLSSPVQGVTDGVISALGEAFRSYIDLVDVRARNVGLERENRELLGEALRSRAQGEELRRVKLLCGFREEHDELRSVPAKVVSREISQFFRVLRLQIDARDLKEVREGQAVVTHDGVVGRIERVGGDSADVMLITDARSAADATIAGKGVAGTARGKGKASEFGADFVHLERAEQAMPIEPGDAVLTSGHDKVFPPGLELGHVVATAPSRQGPYVGYALTPAVTFATLEEVLIIVGQQPGTSGLPAGQPRALPRVRSDPANIPDG